MADLWKKMRRTATKIGQDVKQDLTYFTPGLAVTHALADLPLRGKAFKPLTKWIQKQRDKKYCATLTSAMANSSSRLINPNSQSSKMQFRAVNLYGSAGSKARRMPPLWLKNAFPASAEMRGVIRCICLRRRTFPTTLYCLYISWSNTKAVI